MSFLSRAFTGGEKRGITSTSWKKAYSGDIPTPFEDAIMHEHVSSHSALSLGVFYACVTLLADTVATLSLKAYREKNGVKELVEPQPALLMNSPYPDTTWFSWLWMMMESLAVTGNAFCYVTARDKLDHAIGLMPIHPDAVHVEIPKDSGADWPDPIYYIDGKRVSNADIVHLKRFPLPGCALGMSPVQKAANAIGLGLAAERYGLRFFKDSANPSGILTTDSDLTPDQAKRAMKQWITSHQGRRLPAVLSGGLKWQPVSLTPEESQFLATRAFQKSEITMWFRIPPHMISDTEKSTSWGTGIEQQSIGFVIYTLMPWLACVEQEITKLLPRGQFAKFNVGGLLRGDVKTRWESYWIGRQAGVYSVNDIRKFEDLPPVKDGDGRLQPSNFVPLGTDPMDLLPTPTTENAPVADQDDEDEESS